MAQGRREDNGEHYTYIHDPDGNMIELVQHPLGLEDSQGRKMELPNDPVSMRWTQKPGFVKVLLGLTPELELLGETSTM